MKCVSFAIALFALVSGNVLAETPMAKVVTLLKDMKTDITNTGKSEQASYEKYSCWCEENLAEKAEDITKAKDKLEELQNNINKNKGGLGSGGATIAQLKKDIGENIASLKEATGVRTKENTEYADEKIQAEQCIGALEAAVKVLQGSGTGKKNFLETFQEAQILSVVAGMRQVVKAKVTKTMKQEDLQVIKQFVDAPEDFFKNKAVSAAQVGHNPFGDYAPQSSRIQGILKSMYDSFTSDLEKDNAEEAERQKAFEELKETKEEELSKLETSLTSESKTDAERTKSVADDKAMRTSTREQLDSDEAFFKSTKAACEKKAKHWSQRSQLRTKEIDGISEAIKILDSDDAKKTFKESQSFLQISSSPHRDHKRTEAYNRLRSLSSGKHNLQIAMIAVSVKTGGHFDDVIVMVDKMIVTLRAEEQEDIEHRDRCEGKQNANKNDKEDAEYTKSQAEAEIKRLVSAIKDKEADIKEITENMAKTKKKMEELKKKRGEENEDFQKAQKADADAIALLEKAEDQLKKFYRDTKALVQVEKQPNTNFEDGDYKGASGAARGVLSILDMLKQDITKEMKSQGQDEIDAQTSYEEDRHSLTENYRASDKAKADTMAEKADLNSKKQDQTDIKDGAQKDVDNENELAADIKLDCQWVEKHFEKRRDSRKAEIDGLQGAKDFLAGAGTDQDLDMP